MKIDFYKYQGAGNDFIMLDGTIIKPELSTEQVAFLCDRHFGIGADGLIILLKDEVADFRMIYYNSDGNESSMCGNGGRCFVAFANHLKLTPNAMRFIAIDGLHEGIYAENAVKLKMIDVEHIMKKEDYFQLNTGSPHYVQFVENVRNFPVVEKAKEIRYSEEFRKNGINVNFVEVLEENSLFVRTYERGVEDETLACGTGVVASALSYATKNSQKPIEVKVQTLGGELKVIAHKENTTFSNVWLIGPAEFVFKGNIEI